MTFLQIHASLHRSASNSGSQWQLQWRRRRASGRQQQYMREANWNSKERDPGECGRGVRMPMKSGNVPTERRRWKGEKAFSFSTLAAVARFSKSTLAAAAVAMPTDNVSSLFDFSCRIAWIPCAVLVHSEGYGALCFVVQMPRHFVDGSLCVSCGLFFWCFLKNGWWETNAFQASK